MADKASSWIWNDMPAPEGGSVRITFGVADLQHVAGKHVANQDEPWEQALGADLRRRLIFAAGEPMGGFHSAWSEFLGHLRPKVATALGAPCIVELTGVKPVRWLALLPDGSVALFSIANFVIFVTCFYPDEVADRPCFMPPWAAATRYVWDRYGQDASARFVSESAWGIRNRMKGEQNWALHYYAKPTSRAAVVRLTPRNIYPV